MILQLDVGNTRAKWRVFDGDRVFGRGAELQENLLDVLRQELPNDEELAVQVTSVAGNRSLEDLINSLKFSFNVSSIYIARSVKRMGDVEFGYKIPEHQGVDRCLAMLAAYSMCLSDYKGVVVVDAGSALTVDVVNCDGRQIDGYIAPGHSMLRDSLLGRTSKIEDGYANSDCEGLSTLRCVNSGVSLMFSELIKKIECMAAESKYRLVVTGGDAGLVSESVSLDSVVYVPDLVLDGLALAQKQGVGL